MGDMINETCIIQLSGFLDSKKIDPIESTIALNKKTKKLLIFLLVDKVNQDVEHKVSELRLDSYGTICRIQNKNDIKHLTQKEYVTNAALITDKANYFLALKICNDYLHEKYFTIKLYIV
jgi:hypothetical protein